MRIVDGRIRRGQVEPLRAAIMIADLRGFTSLSDREWPQVVIEALDEFFGLRMSPPRSRPAAAMS